MKTSFKKARRCFLKRLPGISYLTQEGYLSGGFLARGAFVRGIYVLILPSPITFSVPQIVFRIRASVINKRAFFVST